MVYSIEESWYGGRHPLTFSEHQQQISRHKHLLKEYREQTKADFDKLRVEAEALDEDDIFSEENIKKALEFSKHVFEASKNCSKNFINLSKAVLISSIEQFKKMNIEAPCHFAAIALGSVAKGEATPYSDLEYAFVVERHSEYFFELAVDSYFQIGNVGETPLKCFDINELEMGFTPNAQNMVSGYKIDGITEWAGNMPTGNGKVNGQSLTFTVDELIEFCKKEAESPVQELADKSDMLSSTVVIYTNEEGETSKLHEEFRRRRIEYEQTRAAHIEEVGNKRRDSFAQDIKKYTFLPDFVRFQPPKNLDLQIKYDIFRYPTLLANNVKVCMAWNISYPWKIFLNLHKEDFLSLENYQYISIVLALSIYLRTSSYLSQQSQTLSVSLYSHAADHSTQLHQLPINLFIILGYLVTPIKQSIQSSLNSNANASLHHFVRCMFKDIAVNNSNYLLKAEVYYFAGRYRDALYELTKEIDDQIEWTPCSEFLSKISVHFPQITSAQKYVELCCYLLYYTENYLFASDYIGWVIEQQEHDVGLWKLLAAHCSTEIDDYKTARQLLTEVRTMF